ncbi:MAG: hypothetical protein P8L18_16120 [Verrucomicrobiota bacterium]|nr:hypothetical protein [Verrucomicrobiota bacterium]
MASHSPLLHILINKPDFRYTLFLILMVFVGAGFYLLPLWNISPETYGKTVRSSIHDIRQAKRLKAEAAFAMANQQSGEVSYTLRLAMMRDGMDPDLYRMVVSNAMAQASQSPSEIRDVAAKAGRLLELTRTNATDVDLVLSYNELRGLDAASQLLLNDISTLTPAHAKRLLRLLFDAGQLDDYLKHRERLAGLFEVEKSEVSYFDLAVEALLSGNLTEAANPIRALQDLVEDSRPETSLAKSLLLEVFWHFRQLEDYAGIFSEIRKKKLDQPLDHARLWTLMQNNGQSTAAIFEASQYWPLLLQHRFVRIQPALRVAEAYLEAGLPERCFELLNSVRGTFEEDAAYWMGHGDLILKAERWMEATSFAVQLRTQKTDVKGLKAYAYFLEGFAQGKLKRKLTTSRAFEALMKEAPLGSETMFLRVAQSMIEVGQGRAALRWLQAHEGKVTDPIGSLQMQYKAALQCGDTLILRLADQSLFEENSRLSGTALRRLETAIFSLRDAPAALAVYLEDWDGKVRQGSEHLLVAYATLLGDDLEGCMRLLNRVHEDRLKPHELALLAFARLECMVRAGNLEEAVSQLPLVDAAMLFPGFAGRLEALQVQIKAFQASGA